MGANFKIVIVGKRNVGKSSLMNLLTGQEVSIVSPAPGTTTDPVRKRMEVPGIGICTFVDTAGLDDEGPLGRQRVESTLSEMRSADLIIAIGESSDSFSKAAYGLDGPADSSNILFISTAEQQGWKEKLTDSEYREKLLKMIADKIKEASSTGKGQRPAMMEGLVNQGDRIVLVCPVDKGAPEGRLILPQVMAIRDILDKGGIAEVVKPEGLEECMKGREDIALVVTDSQVFAQVARTVPENVALTSFSMLLARSKGDFQTYVDGMSKLDDLHCGDKVLMLESCTHHASCDDIGRVKIPKMLQKYAACTLEFDFVSGLDQIRGDLGGYALAIQCGGCMVTAKELEERLRPVKEAGIPTVNYGMAIAYVNGIFKRAVAPLLNAGATRKQSIQEKQ